MTDIELAAENLDSGRVTFAAAKDGVLITSEKRGIKPLLDLYTGRTDMNGWSCADKVVGKAPAMMYVLLGVSEVFAPVMTKTAKDIMESAGIKCTSDTLADVIMRRDGKDLCPMEKAVKNIDDPAEAVTTIQKTAAELAVK